MTDFLPPPAAPDAVRFLHRGEVRTLASIDPNMTVLRWLREVERRTGTKEGCAEGDCGACTVVLGSPDGDGMRYRAVNACILLLPALDGQELVTVEDLKAPDGTLHPVQQAMVAEHGSQCGFCTPGFVMSLFALYQAEPRPSRPQVFDALAGNLCRCTGYRPIVAAAERMHAFGERDAFAARAPETAARLRAIQRPGTLAVEGAGRRYFAPRTVADLAALYARHPDALLLAGGTDLALLITKQHRDLDTLIAVTGIPEMRTVETQDGWLDIGAAAPYSDAAGAIAAAYPDFGELIRRLGSVQIRNAGTLGGNIANGSPIGDSMPALLALGAELVLRRGGETRTVPLDAFYTGYRRTVLQPAEFVERIRLPLPRPGLRFATYKLSKRFDQDISAVCGAFAVMLDGGRVLDARIAYGGMAAIPKRAAAAERALAGRPWDEAAVAAAEAALAEEFAPIGDMRASAEYRGLAARRLLRRFHLESLGRDDTRVLDRAGAIHA